MKIHAHWIDSKNKKVMMRLPEIFAKEAEQGFKLIEQTDPCMHCYHFSLNFGDKEAVERYKKQGHI